MELKRYALAVEYDGRAFNGWQIQPDVITVQGEMERAVGRMAGHPLRVHAAGRTDAGVHATRQIVHFDTDANRPLTAWVRGVNSFLPSGVSVLWAQQVPVDFHSRFVATARHYRYLLLQHAIRPGIMAGQIGWIHNSLDLEKIHQASRYLLGEHDFSSFRAAECQALSPVKQMLKVDIGRQGDLIYFDFSATAFLHHMVRNIMGALLHIGKGNEPADWMSWLIAQQNRSVAPPTFMPDGLYLTGVSYPEKYGLATEPVQRFGLI
ncbi:tRNA pseudouridine(38-40) synthase TruA [Chitinibacter sp. S2-10]|uniref:tRNA pseudouridine(38-40) synthase TruA n=1 Tax=Chitinibacter sp. S2-10 TaxID=3373597 RepID=UPI003977A827